MGSWPTLSDLLYRLSLLAYPRRFRRRYGPAMLELFRVRMARATRQGGIAARLRCLASGLADSTGNAVRERFGRSALYESSHRPTPGASARLPHPAPRGPMSIVRQALQELRHAARRLAQAPLFTLAALTVLAVGIGANTTLFSVVSALLLRPQPFAAPERLVDIYQDSDGGDPNSCSFPAYRDIAAHDRVFEGVAAVVPFFTASLLQAGGVQTLSVEFVTANYFDVLGLDLQLGRDFEPADDRAGGPPLAILADRVWRNLYGADPGILGETLRLDGAAVTVIGIGPRGYGGYVPGIAKDAFLSLSALGPVVGDFAAGTLERREDHWFQVKGRLAPGVTPAQAQTAMDALQQRLASEFPELNEGRDITVFAPGEVRMHPDGDAEVASGSAALMILAGLLLLLVCSNVANLFLVRATGRGHEVSLRLALGAPRGRILGYVLSESLLLGVVGGGLGVLGANWAIRFLRSGAVPLPLPGPADLRLDGQVLVFSAVVAVGAGLLFGAFPALRLARSESTGVLRGDGPSTSGSTATRWIRNGLVACQVAISFVILVVAGLYARSLVNAQATDLGFHPAGLAVLRADAADAGYDSAQAEEIFGRFEERVAALPGVESVARAQQLPVRGGGGSSTLLIEGYTPRSGTSAVEVDRAVVGPGYFETLGVPLLHGRAFARTDTPDTPSVAVVSRAMAEAFWGRTDVVGERIGFQGSDTTVPIVGVVGDVHVDDIVEEPTPLFYFSSGQFEITSTNFLVRTSGPAEAQLPVLRRTLHDIDATVPVLRLTTMRQHIRDALALPRIGTAALAGFGLLGLLLAGLGLYAVVAFAVQRRTRELGIRIALGAGRNQVMTMVVREMIAITAAALLLGLLAAWAVTPSLIGGLAGVNGLRAESLLGTALILALTATAAAWVPARRAARLDPAHALRED